MVDTYRILSTPNLICAMILGTEIISWIHGTKIWEILILVIKHQPLGQHIVCNNSCIGGHIECCNIAICVIVNIPETHPRNTIGTKLELYSSISQ